MNWLFHILNCLNLILKFLENKGWLSPALPQLSDAETTPLSSGPLNVQEGSWIGSVNCLGSFICYIIYGYLISAVGSKHATLLLTIPSLLGWSLIYFGDNYYYVLLGRFLGGGVSGAATATVSLYVTEISNDNIRGRLSCLSMFSRNVGILLAYIIGSTLPYKYVPCICLMVPVVFFILFAPLQNTCSYYLGQGKPHVSNPKKICSTKTIVFVNQLQVTIQNIESRKSTEILQRFQRKKWKRTKCIKLWIRKTQIGCNETKIER